MRGGQHRKKQYRGKTERMINGEKCEKGRAGGMSRYKEAEEDSERRQQNQRVWI